LPTALPRPPRVEQKRSRFSIVFNAFMVLSALILTFIVLVREQGYANGQPGIFADTIVQMTQQIPPARSGDGAVIPPSN
jgi:hypothetical protein